MGLHEREQRSGAATTTTTAAAAAKERRRKTKWNNFWELARQTLAATKGIALSFLPVSC